MRRASSIIFFPIQSGGKCIWNIKPEISNLSEDPKITAGECGQHYATCILDSYLTDQDVGLSDMGSSANYQSNLAKIPKQEVMPTEVLLK